MKLGAVLGASAIVGPVAGASADAAAPAPSAGGMSYVDPSAPTVFADGSTLVAPLGQMLGGPVSVTGTVAGTKPGDTIAVQQVDASGTWATIATAPVGADGRYSATWTPAHSGKTTVRAVPATATTATRVAAASTTGVVEGRALTLYRRARVTWYGPGFYGRKTACGKRMSRKLLGVANKSLPCGTMVELYNNGNVVTVPVVDRGPFRKGTSYDLTSATAQALGVTATATIGAVRAAVPVVTSAPAAAAAAAAKR